ncbi:hypothetical protein SYK_06000 [Pseudodesulfovibrio nedwellii]|uniref:Uncharacterized protein n=1 Tax=Pseudodesulfovibrio nedwellii TaxID=2973072 RepID=A0ABM8AXQ6_9BACT|nr:MULTISPECIES: hypothetical protein [Pseudodesulfovibrio]BDQ36240.1 hypothetical protein SYK_06000 [Pseudodesulfovibrio nedwellii]
MSGVAPIGSVNEYQPLTREDERERIEPDNQPPVHEKSTEAVQGAIRKQSENETIYGFKYTGRGSFIDKVF